MSNKSTQLVKTGTETKKHTVIRNGQAIEVSEIEVVHTRLVDIPKPCKQCRENPRAMHSSRCTKCSEAHEAKKREAQREAIREGVRQDRLQQKIAAQINHEKNNA